MTACPRRAGIVMAVIAAVLSAPTARADDWPQWRASAGRGAWTPEVLPVQLNLQWVLEQPAPVSCWPWNQYKQQFDASYEPVAAGKLLIVGSMVRDSVSAYDTDTGKMRWRFYTDGPVRFAPVIHNPSTGSGQGGKVIFGCDDGYIYALSAADGSVVWKRPGAPLQRKILANGRLSSMYPVRGGPVLYDGKLYVAAGVWPFLGTFLYCLDPDSGKVIWENSGSGAVYILQPHHSPAFAGAGPQGYLVATKDRLLVPGGRAVPAGYDRETGNFLWLHADTKHGGYEVWANDRVYWNAGLVGQNSDGRFIDQQPGKNVNYRLARVFSDALAWYVEGGRLVARNAQGGLMDGTTFRREGPYLKRYGIKIPNMPEVWQTDTGGAMSQIYCAAGQRVYGGKENLVAAADKSGVVWQAPIEGKIWNMLVADGKLFVVTREGRIYCFSAAKAAPVTHAWQTQAPTGGEPWQAKARALAAAAGTGPGYAVILGIGSGSLVDNLVTESDLDVIVLEPDAAKAHAARLKYDSAGWYGNRVHVVVGDLTTLQMPPYLARIVASEAPIAPAVAEKAFAMARPYGGAVCLKWSADQPQFRRRDGALPGSDDWTHQYSDASNDVFSADKLVKAPLGMLWFGGPSNIDVLPRHGHGPTPQVAGGRLIIEGITDKQVRPGVFEGNLQCRDVYTGRTLWKRVFADLNTRDMYYNDTYNPDPYDRSYNQRHYPGANWFGSNYVTTEDKIYLINQQNCLVLDAATGKTVATFQLPEQNGKRPNWGFLAVEGKYLIATASPINVPAENSGGGIDTNKFKPVIPKNDTWQYLAGSHPSSDAWTKPGFKPDGWKTGKAGFGYGDNDDKTVLSDMRRKYTAVYCRHSFTVDDVSQVDALALAINYDDGFIAYINGKEVVRSHGVSGRGASVRGGFPGHEAKGHEYVKLPADVLQTGENVLAIEGHNNTPGSSDFSLDPFLLMARKDSVPADGRNMAEVPGVEADHRFAPQSQRLVVMDRDSGKVLWTRPARYSWRHNAIVAGGKHLYALDRLNDTQVAYLTRRGVVFNEKAALYAMDLATGKVLWNHDEKVFGTWLGYSAEHDVLLQGGSRFGDRGYDEVGQGMTAFKGDSGKMLWHRDDSYGGPPVLYHDKIFTQTGGADRKAEPATVYELLTGKPATTKHLLTGKTIPFQWTRYKGCNTAIASEHLLTFRSASAAFVPLNLSTGTASIGGFKSGCTSNLIVANGVLNAPDYTRTCTCSYQNQSSLAMVPMPELEYWSFDHYWPVGDPTPVDRAGINLGAPGNRTDDDRTLWLEFPSIGGPSPDLPVQTAGKNARWFRAHNTTVTGEYTWVAASGVEGIDTFTLRPFLQPEARPNTIWGYHKHYFQPNWGGGGGGNFPQPKPYTVRLVFAEPDADAKPGDRIFDVVLNGKTVLTALDITKEAGGPRKSLVKEFKSVPITDDIALTLKSIQGRTILCGVQVIAE